MLEIEDLTAVQVVTLTIWGEARGEGPDGMLGVAWVIKNRQDNPRWWGVGWQGVCLKPWQFSCWNENDPNRALMLTSAMASQSYYMCRLTAESVMGLDGEIPKDPTLGADSYYAESIKMPVWAERAVFTRKIGTQRFYKVELK